MKTYDVVLSYPIQVNAKDKEHVKKIIMDNEHLGNVPELTLEIKEAKDGSK
jgi:hypothetical protein